MNELPIVSLAKREEEIFLVGRSDGLRLPRRSPSLRLLQRARDEAHRFGVAYSRKRHSSSAVAYAGSAARSRVSSGSRSRSKSCGPYLA